MSVRGDRHARDRNHAHDHGPVASMWAAALAALTLMVPALVLIVGGNNNGRAAFDSTAYHERFIRAMAESFPSFDLSNPLTATTPGYHILVATAAQFGAESTMAMRLVSMVVGCAFVATVAAWIARRTGAGLAYVFTLPLIASIYVVGSAARSAAPGCSTAGSCLRAPSRVCWRRRFRSPPRICTPGGSPAGGG
jgi:hypothetical protein